MKIEIKNTLAREKWLLAVLIAGVFLILPVVVLAQNGCALDSDGDGVVDCEDACPNQSGPPSNNGCPLPICGNGIPEAGEQCDNGGANGSCPATCSNSCTINNCQPPPPPVPHGCDAQGLWPIVPQNCPEYGWPQLVLLGQRLINFMIALAIPLSAVAFAWAGFIYITAAGSEEKIKRAHSIFWKVAIGFLLVLGAWLIVFTITQFLAPGFSILQGN